MDIILSTVRSLFALVYLDDVIFFSKITPDPFGQVDAVLNFLRMTAVFNRLEKCKVFVDQVAYLGHIILPAKLAIAAKTCEAVKNFKTLKTKRTNDASWDFAMYLAAFSHILPEYRLRYIIS